MLMCYALLARGQRVAGTSKAEVLVLLSAKVFADKNIAHQWKHWKLRTRFHRHRTLYESVELQQRSLRIVRLVDNFEAG